MFLNCSKSATKEKADLIGGGNDWEGRCYPMYGCPKWYR